MDYKTQQDQRTHARYELRNEFLGTVLFSDNEKFIIRDLSYAGFSMDGKLAGIIYEEVLLSFLGKTSRALVKLIYRGPHSSGFAFRHQNAEVLTFLQPIVEKLRMGSTLVKLDPEVLRPEYQSNDWIIMRGDGAVDLGIKKVHGLSMLEGILLVYGIGPTLYEFRYENGRFVTSARPISAPNSETPSAPTDEPDHNIIRDGIFILAGISNPEVRSLIIPLLSMSSKFLGAST